MEPSAKEEGFDIKSIYQICKPPQAEIPKIVKMKKRLRKKKHHGEFTQWGRQILIIRNRDDGLDDFLDAFIDEAIEANGCYCGGGGTARKLSFVVELGRRSDSPDDKLKRIAEWLDSRTDIENWKAGEEFDLWHGDFNDLEGED